MNNKKLRFIFFIVMCLILSANTVMGECLTREEYLAVHPQAPIDLTAKVIDNAVVLNWKPAPPPNINGKLAYDPIVDHYVIYRRKEGGSIRRLAATMRLVYEDKTAVNDTVYFYSVAAVQRGDTESSLSDEVSVIVNPPHLEDLVIKTPVIAFGEIIETLYDDSVIDSGKLLVSVTEVLKGGHIFKEIEVYFIKQEISLTDKDHQQYIFFLRWAKGKYFIARQPNHQGLMPVVGGEVFHGLSTENGEKEELSAFLCRLKSYIK